MHLAVGSGSCSGSFHLGSMFWTLSMCDVNGGMGGSPPAEGGCFPLCRCQHWERGVKSWEKGRRGRTGNKRATAACSQISPRTTRCCFGVLQHCGFNRWQRMRLLKHTDLQFDSLSNPWAGCTSPRKAHRPLFCIKLNAAIRRHRFFSGGADGSRSPSTSHRYFYHNFSKYRPCFIRPCQLCAWYHLVWL